MTLSMQRRILVLFALTTAAFVFVGWKIESHVRETHRLYYNGCVARNENVERMNAQNKALWNSEVGNTTPGIEDVKAKRLAIYAVEYEKADCGEKP